MSEKPSRQKGLTLVELLIAMIVGAMIAGAVVASMFQLFTVSDRNSDYAAAFTQVQNAGYWVSHDAVQAQEVWDEDDPGAPVVGFLILEWVDWGGDAHRIVYTLEDASGGLKELKRTTYSFDENGDPQLEETIVVAQYIQYIDNDPTITSSIWGEGVLTLKITAQVGDQTVKRTYKVEPRPLS